MRSEGAAEGTSPGEATFNIPKDKQSHERENDREPEGESRRCVNKM